MQVIGSLNFTGGMTHHCQGQIFRMNAAPIVNNFNQGTAALFHPDNQFGRTGINRIF